jgi:hypothetical protein
MSTPRRGGEEPALIAGVVLLVVGVAFLVWNMGAVAINWGLLWPLILIGIGAVVLVGALRRPGRGPGLSALTIPVDGARRLELTLRVGAGRYRLAGGSGNLVEVTANDATIRHASERSGDLARVRLSPAAELWSWGWRTDLDWQIAVASDVPTTIDVQAGAGDFVLDLSAIAVSWGVIQVGAASLRVVLPRPRGEVGIRVEGGAARMAFAVPAGVEARVAATGLVSVSGPSETPGYGVATDRVNVSVTGGAASVIVSTVR